MSDLITSQMLSDWRANYGLDKRTPIKAMHWWQDNMDGKAPAGVVAALGLCINEIERLTASLKRANETAEHFERHWYLRGDEIERLTAERDELRRQLAEAGESIARQAATIRGLTRPADES